MFKRFDDLEVWKEAREFRKSIYELSKKFPKEELFVLIGQIRRSAISITSNIAEGHGRYHWQENIQFCRIARGSLNETLDHIYCALDCKYISEEKFNTIYNNGRNLEKMLNGYIRFLEKQKVK